MPTLKELNPQVGDSFKAEEIDSFFVKSVNKYDVFGDVRYSNGHEVKNCHFALVGLDDWERIEPDTNAEPEEYLYQAQHVYAYLAAQYGIVIIADGVTYDGTKAHLGGECD